MGICALAGGDHRFRAADTLLRVVADVHACVRVEQKESGCPDAFHADVQLYSPVPAVGTAGVFGSTAQQRSGRSDGHWRRPLVLFPRRCLPSAGRGATAAHHTVYHVSMSNH
jgi:hypothetical protein